MPAQTLRDAEYFHASKPGIDHIYRLEHDEAIEFYRKLAEARPEHPGPQIAGAVAIWFRELFLRQDFDLARFIAPGYFTKRSGRHMPPADVAAFFTLIARSRELAKRFLETHPGDKDARYYLGSSEGALGAFALTIERSHMKALRHGKKAYQYQKALVNEDPDFNDSYMTVGTYEYILGNLPWYIKWIATIAGYHGSEERGFRYLVRAAEKGFFVTSDARVLLMVLYVREKEYGYALAVSEQLHNRYPENFLLHLNRAQILERMGERKKAVDTYLDAVRFAEDGRKNYQKLDLGTFRYPVGEKLLELGYPDQALGLFQDATRDHRTPERERALSHLRAGEVLDLMGKRDEAVSQYQEVQRLNDVDDSHRRAGKLLKSPYRE